jgi:hypothetical protein
MEHLRKGFKMKTSWIDKDNSGRYRLATEVRGFGAMIMKDAFEKSEFKYKIWIGTQLPSDTKLKAKTLKEAKKKAERIMLFRAKKLLSILQD